MSIVIEADSTLNNKAIEYLESFREYSTLNMEPSIERSFDLSWLSGLDYFIYFVLAAVVLLLVIILVRNWDVISAWFCDCFLGGREKTKSEPHRLEESDSLNIFGHNFDGEIADCVRKQNYALAVRLLYLKTLYYMENHNCIKWAENKTATEYYYEYSNKSRRPLFHELTSLYLVATYADNVDSLILESTFKHAKELNQQITKL